jgi:glycosyltransferase involved in cell wall biosynthesis
LRVGILGILAQHKGLNEVLKLLDLCEDLPFKFVLFGEICLETAPKKLAVLGKYDRTTLQTLVKAYKIDIFLIPSICPETFSYTTHEVIALGYPLVCFALGAQAESVGAYDKGQIAKDISAEALKDELVKFYEGRKRV